MRRLFHVDPDDPMPLYAQLERAIRFAIATGRLQIGAQLPTVRQLAVDLRINANTVAKVYAELEGAGIIQTRRGVGTFVCAQPTKAAHPKHLERELRLQEDRFLTEAARLGYSSDELLAHLASRLKKGGRKNG